MLYFDLKDMAIDYKYFNVDFDSNELFLFYISEKYLQFRKKSKSTC